VKSLNKTNWESRNELYKRLTLMPPEELPIFLKENAGELLSGSRLFSDFMRAKFKEKEILQQNVFLAADISENYGYKLIAEEKHTIQRDVILRICLAARFDLDETQKALILYRMAPLWCRLPRDIVFLSVITHRIFDIHQVNDLLIRCGQAPLVKESG